MTIADNVVSSYFHSTSRNAVITGMVGSGTTNTAIHRSCQTQTKQLKQVNNKREGEVADLD